MRSIFSDSHTTKQPQREKHRDYHHPSLSFLETQQLPYELANLRPKVRVPIHVAELVPIHHAPPPDNDTRQFLPRQPFAQFILILCVRDDTGIIPRAVEAYLIDAAVALEAIAQPFQVNDGFLDQDLLEEAGDDPVVDAQVHGDGPGAGEVLAPVEAGLVGRGYVVAVDGGAGGEAAADVLRHLALRRPAMRGVIEEGEEDDDGGRCAFEGRGEGAVGRLAAVRGGADGTHFENVRFWRRWIT